MGFEWWVWIVGGISLALVELLLASFFILWFGMGALLVGLITLAWPEISLTAQLATWTGASLAMVVLWFRIFKPGFQKTKAGTAAGDVIGEIGLLVADVQPFARGRVRFQRPILGTDEWACMADTAIAAGERVRLLSVEGSYLKVEKS
ncbi:MAG: NfeD family protein [Azonexus sp.]|nr:NfeD family protein [Betaproteobacteria bacterium]MBK8919120.1 NfeD family protein [Betaproteobacteria bacterium]MBP6036558.1 NfeD family protein [Azonexus sp.]MBP6907166.1 NfeD family protein [Azonexus sp.]